MKSDFDRSIDRSGTGSLKWDRYMGRDVLPFWVADMDLACAPVILEALRRRLEHPVFGYTRPYREVQDAVLDYLRSEHGVAAERQWLLFLPGLVPALNTACRAYARRHEEVLICKPVYPPFFSAPVNQKRRTVSVPLVRRDGRFTFDWQGMEAALTPSTRLFILCNPHNPVGRVFTRGELERLASFCARYDLVIASDEIHCDLVLEEGLKHTSMLALDPVVAERTVLFIPPGKNLQPARPGCALRGDPERTPAPALRSGHAGHADGGQRLRLRRVCGGLPRRGHVARRLDRPPAREPRPPEAVH
jgi:cystathionine beta-lyase